MPSPPHGPRCTATRRPTVRRPRARRGASPAAGRRRHAGPAAVLLGAAWVAVGCVGPRGSAAGPERSVTAYVAAVRAGDAEGVHALLDARTRAETTPAEIAAHLAADRAELREQTDALARRVGDGGVPTRARVALRSGRVVALVRERDGEGPRAWRLEGGLFDAAALATPEDAVRALRTALAARSLPGVLRVLARGPRGELEAELAAIVDETADADDLAIEASEERATVRTPSGRVLRLVREAGEWRVEDIGAPAVPP